MLIVFHFGAYMFSYLKIYLPLLHSKIYRLVLHTLSQFHAMMLRKPIIHITWCHALDYSDQWFHFSTYLFSPWSELPWPARKVSNTLYSVIKPPFAITKSRTLDLRLNFLSIFFDNALHNFWVSIRHSLLATLFRGTVSNDFIYIHYIFFYFPLCCPLHHSGIVMASDIPFILLPSLHHWPHECRTQHHEEHRRPSLYA